MGNAMDGFRKLGAARYVASLVTGWTLARLGGQLFTRT